MSQFYFRSKVVVVIIKRLQTAAHNKVLYHNDVTQQTLAAKIDLNTK